MDKGKMVKSVQVDIPRMVREANGQKILRVDVSQIAIAGKRVLIFFANILPYYNIFYFRS